MNVRARQLLALVPLVLFGVHAQAATLDYYGGLDSLVAEDYLSSSGESAEEQWIQSVLGESYVLGDKIDADSGGESWSWNKVDGDNEYYAMDLSWSGTDQDYFLLKTGAGADDGHNYFLYENLDSLAYAVIDLAALGFDSLKLDITKISHVSTAVSQVPLPAAAWLFLSGLAGLFAVTRRNKAKASAAALAQA